MSERIAVIGLGYVGLPVALAFARKFEGTVGFDISKARVRALAANKDWTGEVTDETLAVEVIEDVVKGPGHFLGQPQTLSLMESEYIYPELGDRERPTTWEEAGSLDIRARARSRVEEVLSTHYPTYIDPAVDAKIRDKFDIKLPAEAMKPGNDRW